MAAPLSGVGQQQQIPLSQSQQPTAVDASREVRQRDQQPREDEIQVRGAALSQTNETETENTQFNLDGGDANNIGSQDIASASGERGSLVDITV